MKTFVTYLKFLFSPKSLITEPILDSPTYGSFWYCMDTIFDQKKKFKLLKKDDINYIVFSNGSYSLSPYFTIMKFVNSISLKDMLKGMGEEYKRKGEVYPKVEVLK